MAKAGKLLFKIMKMFLFRQSSIICQKTKIEFDFENKKKEYIWNIDAYS